MTQPTMTDDFALIVPPGAGRSQFVLEHWRLSMLRRSMAADAERSRQKPKRTRGRSRFTQSEVTRFLKGAKKVDPNATVKMNTDCSMVIVPGNAESTSIATENEWDQVK